MFDVDIFCCYLSPMIFEPCCKCIHCPEEIFDFVSLLISLCVDVTLTILVFICRRWAVTSYKSNGRVSAIYASVARIQILVSEFVPN